MRAIFLFLFFSTLVAGWSLLQPGFPPTHDGEYHVIRFYEFFQAFSMGQWYPRWAPDLNNGYGVPLFNYVYPLPNYVALLLHAFGISFIDAFKLNMFFAILVGALFMYLWARVYWEAAGAVVSSIFYTYAPYHFLDIYIRGSVGEVWALGFFPAFLWAVTHAIREKQALFVVIGSLFLSFIIFSHNILALMFFPFALSYMLFLFLQSTDKKNALKKILVILFLGIGLSSIFWLPALLEREYVRGLEVFDYRAHFVQVHQLIFPTWGSGFSADPTTEGLSFQIGIAHLLVLFLVILIIIQKRMREQGVKIFMLIWTIVAVFFMLPVSLILWNNLPLIQYFQFPWRFLSLIILCTSFLAGGLAHQKKSKIVLGILIVLPIVLTIGYTKPAYYHMRDDAYYITRSNFIDGTNSPGDTFNTIWFNRSLPKATKLIEYADDTTRINVTYFPGWQVFADGKSIEVRPSKDGVLETPKIREGATLEIKFVDTKIRAISKFFSIASFLLIFLLLLRWYHARMKV